MGCRKGRKRRRTLLIRSKTRGGRPMTSGTVLETETERGSFRDRRIFTNTLVVILGVIWGLAFVAIRTADFQLSLVNLTILRWLIASAAFLTLSPSSVKPHQ